MRGRKRPNSPHPAIIPESSRFGLIDLANNFAITPLQSHPSEIRRSDLHLAEADVPRVGATPRGAVVAEDVRNLQSWTLHDPRPLRRRLTPATSSGPLTWVLGRVRRRHDLWRL